MVWPVMVWNQWSFPTCSFNIYSRGFKIMCLTFTDYCQLSFREELVRQLGGIEDEEDPQYEYPWEPPTAKQYSTNHLPINHEGRYNCKVCYLTKKKQVKTSWGCTAPVCRGQHFCLSSSRNCYGSWHSSKFHSEKRKLNVDFEVSVLTSLPWVKKTSNGKDFSTLCSARSQMNLPHDLDLKRLFSPSLFSCWWSKFT